MQSIKVRESSCNFQLSYILHILGRKVWHLCSRIRWPSIWRRSKPRVIIRRFGKLSCKGHPHPKEKLGAKSVNLLNGQPVRGGISERPIRIATFNVAMFSLAPAVPKAEKSVVFVHEDDQYVKVGSQAKSMNSLPKSILKQSPLHPAINYPEHLSEQVKLTKAKLRVSINLPDNEISLAHNKVLGVVEDEKDGCSSKILSTEHKSQVPMRSPVCFPPGMSMINYMDDGSLRGSRTILDVLREVNADILALQDVKAEEEKNMKPLSDLARALGMKYVFAESWAPEYGNAILSKWPIKRWKVQKIFDDQDFRNVLKATIDVPRIGEINFFCTQLDHLDESWRMKQINAIIQSNDYPHILAGGLNSLDGSDYSLQRWTDIAKYYEEIGKPAPKVEVTKFLKGKGYADAKDFAGECEPVVIIAKGQSVQGTCKYGTRVDYILNSSDLPYKFVPGSYSVISSKGTSDHHIVKVDIAKAVNNAGGLVRRRQKVKRKVVRIVNSCSSSEIDR
ncbi:uncharacterized protein LOC132294739 [Cornus florida]|uniref:uncharacterized protein LOC132294739 n=1 Tax=Cornus florida TaxID=4283 RepID=UPI00289DC268|nr:uncharacterized protein LOC132294739 [Cornus florida]